MRLSRRTRLVLLLALLACSPLLWAQKKPVKEDNVFRLVQAERAEQYEQYGLHYRLVKGHARFLHNDTYLLCDSASWNVDSKFIEAYGHVQLIQNNTMLKSEEMFYWIDDNKAQFRGPLVELYDKDGNTLRTGTLTYNTKDSVAVFEFGGALKEKDGGVIESAQGTYDAKEGLFTFTERVEIFLDSVEMTTSVLRYYTEDEKAHFGRNTNVWRDDGFLRADGGWQDRKNHVIHFSNHVFMFDPSYDAWADEVYYNQLNGAVDLVSNAQVLDTTNKSIYLGDHLQYLPADDSLSDRGVLTGDPAIIYFGENEDHEIDTLYVRADTFYVYAVPRCDIPEDEVKEAEKRLEDIQFDALGKKRTEEAAVREKQRIQKMRDAGKLPPEWVEQQQKAEADSLAALARLDSLVTVGVVDSLVAAADSIRSSLRSVDSLLFLGFKQLEPEPPAPAAAPDSLANAAVDSLPPRDTTPVRFVHAWNNVRLYRSDIQAVCDSIVFTELDSIARLYGSPALWNEVRNQLTADEMQLLMKDGALSRGSMITNAWLISQQDTAHYNQIKSTEMQGWFRDNKLYRFDALGGVSAIFYLTDEEVITTINVKESKSLTAAMKDATAQRLLYVESIKSDAYPVGELPAEKQRLKDFKWRGDERPVSRDSITTRRPRESERDQYAGLKRPLYRETNKFFNNYLLDLFEKRDAEKRAEMARRKAVQDSLLKASMLEEQAREHEAALPVDSTAAVPVLVPDSTSVAIPDSVVIVETPVVMTDTTAVAVEKAAPVVVQQTDAVEARPERIIDRRDEPEAVPASPETVIRTEKLTRAEKRALRRAERQARRAERRAVRALRRAARHAERHR